MKALVSNSRTEARCQKVKCQVVQLLSLDSTTNFHTEMYTKINSDKISIAIALTINPWNYARKFFYVLIEIQYLLH